MAKTHPHITSPTQEQLVTLLPQKPAELVKVYLALHKLVVSVVPKLEFSVDVVDAGVGYGAHQFGYNGWGMAALSLHNRWVRLTLLQGSRLEDPAEIMEGSSTMRHVKISTMSEVETKREAVEAILIAASTVNQG